MNVEGRSTGHPSQDWTSAPCTASLPDTPLPLQAVHITLDTSHITSCGGAASEEMTRLASMLKATRRPSTRIEPSRTVVADAHGTPFALSIQVMPRHTQLQHDRGRVGDGWMLFSKQMAPGDGRDGLAYARRNDALDFALDELVPLTRGRGHSSTSCCRDNTFTLDTRQICAA